MGKYILIGSRGCGSVIVELALLKAGAEFELEEIPYLEPGPDRDRLLQLNPLGQVPTLIMPDGDVMTESAAMILHLAGAFPDAQLSPATNDRHRSTFLRWLIYIVGEIYPTSTFGDDPGRWQLPSTVRMPYKQAVDDHRMQLWSHVEEVADTPCFLGNDFSAIDLYIAVMRHWRPGLKEFGRAFPKLNEIGATVARDALFSEVLQRNFEA
ncbi:MAG: glutathione S-transferase family protein [Phyllobacterium sp.]